MNDRVRSLNLVSAAGIVVYEAIRQLGPGIKNNKLKKLFNSLPK